ncbi:hypothetical protein N4E61_14030, partial [Staphylococcus aureus]|nr:hypothetical protein [Staphylococcus aureus]
MTPTHVIYIPTQPGREIGAKKGLPLLQRDNFEPKSLDGHTITKNMESILDQSTTTITSL